MVRRVWEGSAMNWIVKLYDLRGFMFCRTSFERRDEAEDYASCFKRTKAIVVRAEQ